MMKVELKNIKNIKKLEFGIPNKRKVYLLTGTNGIGKTTLLTCLANIGDSQTLGKSFVSTKLYGFEGAEIVFSKDGDNVTYKKKTKRWGPTTSKSLKGKNIRNDFFPSFGFCETLYIKIEKRVSPKEEKFNNLVHEDIDAQIKDDICTILESSKFKELKKIKTGSRSYVLSCNENHTDRQFSSGEIAIVKLILRLAKVKNGALLIIDEAEMSLHPKVQVNLLKYLEDFAKKKQVTIIVSTHSSTLIKMTKKEFIYFLERDVEDEVKCVHPCYPAYAVQMIAPTFEVEMDVLFLVEDDEAKIVLTELLDKFATITRKKNIGYSKYRILPIGGKKQVLSVMESIKNSLVHNTKMYAVLDKDVFDELAELKQKGKPTDRNREWIAMVGRNQANVIYLPLTPEKDMPSIIKSSPVCQSHIEARLNSTILISDIMKNNDYLKRTDDKFKWKYIVNRLSDNTEISSERIKRNFYQWVIENMLDDIYVQSNFEKCF